MQLYLLLEIGEGRDRERIIDDLESYMNLTDCLDILVRDACGGNLISFKVSRDVSGIVGEIKERCYNDLVYIINEKTKMMVEDIKNDMEMLLENIKNQIEKSDR